MSRPSTMFASRMPLAVLSILFVVHTDLASAADSDALAEPVALPTVVVTPTRLPTPESEVGSSITVITEEEIQRKQERTLPDALKDVPGLNVVQTGGPGGTTSVFIRGANSNQTKVFIDGIDATDPATGTFNFEHILTWDIERVEVVRGPQSGLYGADAIGGVINTSSRRKGRGQRSSRAAWRAARSAPSTRMPGSAGLPTGSITISTSPTSIRATRPLRRPIWCRQDGPSRGMPTITRHTRRGSAPILLTISISDWWPATSILPCSSPAMTSSVPRA